MQFRAKVCAGVSHDSVTTEVTVCFIFAWCLSSVVVPMIVYCRCGSDRVDITQWNGQRCLFTCYTCNQSSWVDGFTLGEFDLMKNLIGAALDHARKHRKRNPSEMQAIQKERGRR
jgi:hypothetical protein